MRTVNGAPGPADGPPAAPAARDWPGRQRWCAVAALLLAVACLVPPVSVLAGRYVLPETVQFACFAMVIPALVVLAAPWRRLGLAARTQTADHGFAPRNADVIYEGARNPGIAYPRPGRPADRLARARAHHRSPGRSAGFLTAFAALAVAWRLPPVIDAVARHPGLAGAEALSLLITGVALWLELVPSPPLVPRGREWPRAVIAAVAMWLIWIIAYILGLATQGEFHAYHYPPGGALSAVADQELGTAVLWVVAAACFMPVIFTSAYRWLHDSDNLETELDRAASPAALPTVKGWGPPRRRKASSG